MRTIGCAALVVIFASSAQAQEWWPVDAQSRGMGNTGVAFAEGPGASHINPANLGSEGTGLLPLLGGFEGGAYLFADVGLEDDTLSLADRISDLFGGFDFESDQVDLNTSGGADESAIQHAMEIIDTVRLLNEDGHGMFANVGGGAEVHLGNFGVFVRQFGTVGADPFADLSFLGASAFSNLSQAEFYGQMTGASPTTPGGQSLAAALLAAGIAGDADIDGVADSDELAFQAETALGAAAVADPGFQQALIQVALNTQANAGGSATSTMFFNGSGVEMRSLLLREIGVSGGFTLPILPMLSSVRVGANIKEVIGETFVKRIELRDIQDGRDIWEEILTEFKGSRRRTNRFNVDLGVSVAPIPWLTVGLSARNILPMEFDFEDPALVDKYRTHTQYKAGVGVSLGGILRAEIDADLRKLGLDQLRDVRSQLVSAGAELSLFTLLMIRAGVYGDLAMKSPKTVVTLGVGLNLWLIKVDVFGQIAATRDQIEQASQFNGSGSDFIPSRAGAGATAGINLKF